MIQNEDLIRQTVNKIMELCVATINKSQVASTSDSFEMGKQLLKDSMAVMQNAMQEYTSDLQQWIDDCQSGMYINCVYCGHRYGPEDQVKESMQQVLYDHIKVCPKHPLSAAIRERDYARALCELMRDALEAQVRSGYAIIRRDPDVVTYAEIADAKMRDALTANLDWIEPCNLEQKKNSPE